MKKVFKKIVIFGRPGSGKSTFTKKLSEATGIPAYHLDKIYFTDNWVKRDNQAYLDDLQNWVNKNEWIIDGNSLRSLEVRWQNADVVVYFNFPFWYCFWNMFKRLFDKDCAIDDRASGCREALRWDLVTYTWRYRRRVKDLIPEMRTKYPQVTFVEIVSQQQIEVFLKENQ